MNQTAKATSKNSESAAVEAYLAAVPERERAALERVRAMIRKVVPDATEVISYGMPTFRHNGRMLVAYGARKDGCSLYGLSAGLSATQADALKGLEFADGTKGTVHFSAAKPLSAAAVKALVRARMAEIAELAATRTAAKAGKSGVSRKRATSPPMTKKRRP